jgi:hypothetical protein
MRFQFAFAVAGILIACRSPQISENWIWADGDLPPSASTTLASRFQTDSEACTEQAQAIKEAERNRRKAPRDTTDRELLLDLDVDPEESWSATYEHCMKSLGWNTR